MLKDARKLQLMAIKLNFYCDKYISFMKTQRWNVNVFNVIVWMFHTFIVYVDSRKFKYCRTLFLLIKIHFFPRFTGK